MDAASPSHHRATSLGSTWSLDLTGAPFTVAALLGPAPTCPGPPRRARGTPSTVEGAASVCRGRGALHPLDEAPVCTQQRREVWGRERPLATHPATRNHRPQFQNNPLPLQQGMRTPPESGRDVPLVTKSCRSPQPPPHWSPIQRCPRCGLNLLILRKTFGRSISEGCR